VTIVAALPLILVPQRTHRHGLHVEGQRGGAAVKDRRQDYPDRRRLVSTSAEVTIYGGTGTLPAVRGLRHCRIFSAIWPPVVSW
jgi:hypothetical protein